MKQTKRSKMSLALLTPLMLGACSAQDAPKSAVQDSAQRQISSDIQRPNGDIIGTVMVTGLGEKGVKVDVAVAGITQGTHAMHFHEFGQCQPPSFKTAGGHYNPDGKAHGMKMENGPHAGDMMNVETSADGTGTFSVINDRVSIDGIAGLPALLDSDGTALILHEKADDYLSQPTGAAGARIGCAVLKG